MSRRVFFLSALTALGVFATIELAACDGAELATYPDCRGSGCSCEQDPSQARCRGFSPEEGGAFEGGTLSDGGVETDGGEAGTDAGTDAADSGDDAADAEDQ